jgi:hypothetical protein
MMINFILEIVKFWRYSGRRKCKIFISSIDDRLVGAESVV